MVTGGIRRGSRSSGGSSGSGGGSTSDAQREFFESILTPEQKKQQERAERLLNLPQEQRLLTRGEGGQSVDRRIVGGGAGSPGVAPKTKIASPVDTRTPEQQKIAERAAAIEAAEQRRFQSVIEREQEKIRTGEITAFEFAGVGESGRPERVRITRGTLEVPTRDPGDSAFRESVGLEPTQERGLETTFEPFTPIGRPPIRREVGFFEGAKEFIGSSTRRLFNLRTQRDLERSLTGEQGIFVRTRTPDLATFQRPTGTVIDPVSGISTQQTQRQRAEETFIIRDLGTPKQFKVENIQRNIEERAQTQLQAEGRTLQRDIDLGLIDVPLAEQRLSTRQTEIETQAQKQFETSLEKELRETRVGEAELRRLRRSERVDIAPALTTAAVVGGFAVAPQVTAPLLVTKGGLELFSAVSEPTTTAKLTRAGIGVLDIGIGSGTFNIAQRQIAAAGVERGLADLQKQPFKIAELQLQKGQTGLFTTRAVRETPTFQQQLDLTGVVLERGGRRFFVPQARGRITTTGVVDEATLSTRPRDLFISSQEVQAGIEGFSLPLDKRTTVSLGRAGFIEGEQFTAFLPETASRRQFREAFIGSRTPGTRAGTEAVGGVSLKLSPDVVISRTGRAGITADVGNQRALVDLELRDIGLTFVSRKGLRQRSFVDFGEPGIRQATVTQQLQPAPQLITQAVGQRATTQFRPPRPQPFRGPGAISGFRPQLADQAVSQRTGFTTQFTAPLTRELPRQRAIVSQPLTIVPTQAVTTRQAQRQRTVLTTVSRQRDFVSPGLTQTPRAIQLESFGLRQRPLLELELATSLRQPGFQPSRSRFGFDFGRGFFLPPFPRIPSGISESRGFFRPRQRKFFRTPSFAAVQLGREAKEPSPLEFTGLVERPIIRRKRRKNK